MATPTTTLPIRFQNDALWSFEETIDDKSFLDWLEAHTSFALPLHHYEGKLSLPLDHTLSQKISFNF